MTNIEKRIKLQDILGNKFYDYNLTSSNYTPLLNASITLTCTVTNVYGDIVTGKSIQLYNNGVAVGSAKTTNNNGVVTWTINCTNEGLHIFKIGYKEIEVFVDNKASSNHTHNQYLTSHQDISGKANISDLSTVATSGSYNDLTDKPNIPSQVTVDSELSSSSSNPVENKVVKSALDNKSNTGHTHSSSDVSDNSAYTNIGTSANSTQKQINNGINTKLGEKALASNVYTKSETYTKSEITTLISNTVSDLDLFEVVEELPSSNIKDNRLYLIVNDETVTNNSYDVYIRVDNSWEQLDKLDFDISNYYNKTEINTLLDGKVDTSDNRLTNARTPTSHTHGDISNTGAIGTTANKPIITGTNGKLTTGTFGTTANTFAEGNHTHNYATSNDISTHNSSGTAHSDIRTSLEGKADTSDIPSKTSDLVNDSGFLTSHQSLSDYIQKSQTNGLIKNDGTIDTNTYLTSHQDITGKEDKTNKSSSIITDTGSTTKYPTVKAVEDYAVQKTSPKDISEFKTLLDNASTGDTITLTNDYIVTSNFNYIVSKDINIDGNGHTIDANNNTFSFQSISTRTLKIENCNFINIKVVGDASAFIGNPMSSSTIIFNNCIFDKGVVKKCLFYIKTGKIKINNCLFKNISLNTEGQIIFINRSNSEIYNTIFENNTITPIYIKNTSLQNNIIKDCVFNNNLVAVLDESAEAYQNAILENNLFLQSGDTLIGCINKNYLTTHQDISGKANTVDLSDVATSGSYNDLTNKPTIPTVPSNVSAFTNDSGYLTSHQDISGKADTSDLGTVAFSNDYTDLDNKPTIPSKTSDLTNDSNFLTAHQDITGKEDKSNKVSSWSGTTSDAHYPSEKLVKDSLDGKSDSGHTHSYSSSNHAHGSITNTGYMASKDGNVGDKNVVTDSSGKITVENKPTIPSKISDLTNDSNFISTSSTNGLIKNDGSIDDNTYLTTSVASSTYVAKENGKGLFSGSYNDLLDKPTIPSAYTHPSTHSSSIITDTNTHNNIGNTSNTLENIITNIDSKLGSLANVDLIEVTSSLPTASASTINKLYLIAESSSATNDNYEIYVTVRTGTNGNYTYAWEKVDTARIDLSNYLTTTNAQQTYLSKTDASNTYQPKGTYLTTQPSIDELSTSILGITPIFDDGNDIYLFDNIKYDLNTLYYNDVSFDDFISTSSTSGLVKNDGTIDTNTYLTSHQDISGKENISNKSSSISTDTGSTTKYPTVEAVEDYTSNNYVTGINFNKTVDDLEDEIDNKADATHTHSISNITNLQNSLDAKQDVSTGLVQKKEQRYSSSVNLTYTLYVDEINRQCSLTIIGSSIGISTGSTNYEAPNFVPTEYRPKANKFTRVGRTNNMLAYMWGNNGTVGIANMTNATLSGQTLNGQMDWSY